tara:strand:+ start:1448 stop:3907 length:2460 start_codon:yes stop_codon:yes gene_type:complete
MATSSTIKAILTLQTEQFTTALERAQSRLSRFGSRLTRTGRDLTFALTVPLAAAGRAIVKVATDFDLIQRKIGALGGTGKIRALEDSARKLGATTVFTATQVGELQLNLRKLGRTDNEIQQIQGTVLKFAQAMDTDLGEAGTFVVQTMNRFNDELSNLGGTAAQAEFVTNLFAKATAESALDIDKLRSSLNFAGSELAQFDISLQSGTALLAVLADRGFEASRGGTALRRILGELAKEGFTGNQAIEELLSSTRGFAQQLEKFGLRGAGSASALAGLKDEFNELNDTLGNSSGFLDRFQSLIDDSLFAKFRRLRSAVEELALNFADDLAPVLGEIIDSITEFVLSLQDLDTETKKTILTIGAFLAALGPLSLFLGGLNTAASGLVGALSKLLRPLAGIAGASGGIKGLARIHPALTVLAGVLGTAAFAFNKVFEGVDKGNEAFANYEKGLRGVNDELERTNELQGIGVTFETTDLQKQIQQLRATFDIEQQKLIDAVESQAFGNTDPGLQAFIDQTQANVDVVADQIVEVLEKIRKAEEDADDPLNLDDLKTTSLNALIEKFRELQELRAELIGVNDQGIADPDFIVNIEALEELDKAISRVTSNIKSIQQDVDPIEPLFPAGTFDLGSDFELIDRVNQARIALGLATVSIEDFQLSAAELDGIEPIEPLLDENFIESLNTTVDRTAQITKQMEELASSTLAFGNIFGDAFLEAAQGTETFANALKNNLIDAINRVIARIIALIIAYSILLVISGGTSPIANAAGKLVGQGGPGFFNFMASGLGVPGSRSMQMQIGTISGSDLALTTRRGVTANDRIYG